MYEINNRKMTLRGAVLLYCFQVELVFLMLVLLGKEKRTRYIPVTLHYARKITHAGCSLRTLRRSRNLFRNFFALSLASGESGWLATARATT